jgi:pyruvate/2-oxoglutarate dehydrogenase complex dihydrolipoamide dehydrogenase (E3) component
MKVLEAVAGRDGRERKLRAKTILIAIGSRPRRPKNISFDIPGVCDTDTILNRRRPPREILIVGGAPVGVEFATICHAIGAKVAMADLGSRLIAAMDGEVSGWMGTCSPSRVSLSISDPRQRALKQGGIYATGDVVKPTLASIAMEQGRAAVCHAFGIGTRSTEIRRGEA